MNSQDLVCIDLRWRENGWLEAIRLRLAGWLPQHLVASGLESGVFEKVQARDQHPIALSTRGLALTDAGIHSFTDENCRQLAEVLMLRGYSEAWLQPESDEIVRCPNALLQATYRKKLLLYLRLCLHDPDDKDLRLHL